MKILDLLFKSTKVLKKGGGILIPRLKSRGYSTIQPFNYSTIQLFNQFGRLKRSGNPDLSGTGPSGQPVGAQRKPRFIGDRPVWLAAPAAGQAIQLINYFLCFIKKLLTLRCLK